MVYLQFALALRVVREYLLILCLFIRIEVSHYEDMT